MAATIHQLKVRTAGNAAVGSKGAAALLADDLERSFRAQTLALLDQFLDMADDRLFEYAGRAGGKRQLDYLLTMRTLRAQRAPIGKRLAEAVTEQLQPGWRPHAVARSEALSHDLKMIEDKIVEQRLAIETTRQRIESNCGVAFSEFKQRLEDARHRFGLQLLDVQFSPRALCLALSEGLRQIDVEVDLLVLVLKIFEQAACTYLPTVYLELSTLLEANGAHGAPRPPAQPLAPAPAADCKPATQEMAAAAPAIVAPATAASSPIRTIAANAAAVEALFRQLRTAVKPAQQSLDAQLAEAVSSALHPAPPEWANAVVLRAAASSWLFDEILGDSNIPASLHAALDVLRAPFIRASLLEEKFVSDAAHPLRRLIQDLASLAVAAKIARPEEVSSIRSIIGEMGSRLEGLALRRDLHSTSAVDEPTIQSFAVAAREAAGLRRNGLIKRARELSTKTIGQGVERHLAAIVLPADVSQTLEKAFAPLLGMILLRSGQASPSFQEAQALLDEFLGAVAHGVIDALEEPGLPARIAKAAAGAGFSVAHQIEVCARVENAFRSGHLMVQAAPAAVHPACSGPVDAGAAHDPWGELPGVEVCEVSHSDIEACAKEIFVPGSWFRVAPTEGGGEVRWMQVEQCRPEQGQVIFTDFIGAQQSVRQIQRLVFEVLSGQCRCITGKLQSDRSLARLASAFGTAGASRHASGMEPGFRAGQ